VATIYDVAREAGVSTGTVSRALNDHPEVGAATRARVIETAARLGYRPDPLARGMITRTTAIVGLVVPDVAAPFFHELARGVEDVASASGQLVVLCNTDRRPEKEQQALRALRAHRVGGLILAGAPLDEAAAHDALGTPGMQGEPGVQGESGAESTPSRRSEPGAQSRQDARGGARGVEQPGVFVIRRGPPGTTWPALLLDYRAAVREEVAYLLALGHRRIGYVNGPGARQNAAERVAGYRQALAEAADAGAVFDPALVTSADFSIEGGYAAAARLLDLPERPTALALANDHMALGALQAARARGLAVPGDLSVVGFDDFAVAALVAPALTTVRVPMREMGARAMRLLLEQMGRRSGRASDNGSAEGEGHLGRVEYVATELVVRESAGQPN
jgi:LacI family transcriptional regulator